MKKHKFKIIPKEDQVDKIKLEQKDKDPYKLVKKNQLTTIHSKDRTCLFCLKGFPMFQYVYLPGKEPGTYIMTKVYKKA